VLLAAAFAAVCAGICGVWTPSIHEWLFGRKKLSPAAAAAAAVDDDVFVAVFSLLQCYQKKMQHNFHHLYLLKNNIILNIFRTKSKHNSKIKYKQYTY